MAGKKLTKRDLASAEKKTHIYKTAIRLFREYGYEATTMADICEASGMSKGSIYHFFAKKIDLLYHFFAELNQDTLENLEINDVTMAQPGNAVLNCCVEMAQAYEQIGYDMAVQLQNVFGEYASQEQHRQTSFVHKMSAFVQAAQERGTMSRKCSSWEIAHQIHIASMGLFRKWIIDGGAYSLADGNRWFIPVVLNQFLPQEQQIEPGAMPSFLCREN